MIPIRYNDKIGSSLEKLCQEMLKKCSPKKLDALNKWCNINIVISGKAYDFKDVVLSDYPTLEKIRNLSSIQSYKKQLEQKKNNEDEYKNYLIHTLYEKHLRSIKDELIDKLEIKVCPYCNRAFIDSVNKRRTYQLDHFFNKDDYPFFAVSFYNLVPCCYGCNYIKGTQYFSYSPHNPAYVHADLLTDFDISISNMDYIRNKDHFEVVITADPIMDENIKSIHLADLYSLHKDDIQETIRRRIVYPAGYVDSIMKQHCGLFASKDEAEHMIYGFINDEKQYRYEPLSKMKSDISRKNGPL